jgi:bifunctional oxygenase/reductase
VNTVMPGPTDNGSPPFDQLEVAKQLAQFSEFKDVGAASDIAAMVAFLASEDAVWTTGAVFDATGGSLLGASVPGGPPARPTKPAAVSSPASVGNPRIS